MPHDGDGSPLRKGRRSRSEILSSRKVGTSTPRGPFSGRIVGTQVLNLLLCQKEKTPLNPAGQLGRQRPPTLTAHRPRENPSGRGGAKQIASLKPIAPRDRGPQQTECMRGLAPAVPDLQLRRASDQLKQLNSLKKTRYPLSPEPISRKITDNFTKRYRHMDGHGHTSTLSQNTIDTGHIRPYTKSKIKLFYFSYQGSLTTNPPDQKKNRHPPRRIKAPSEGPKATAALQAASMTAAQELSTAFGRTGRADFQLPKKRT